MKRLAILVLLLSILTGCAAKSAKQHGAGISVEMTDSLNVKHLTLIKFVDGEEAFSENVINADNSPFEKGELVWFDVSPSATNSTVELALSYSTKLDGTDANLTEKIDISNANEWVNVTFNKGYYLSLLDKK